MKNFRESVTNNLHALRDSLIKPNQALCSLVDGFSFHLPRNEPVTLALVAVNTEVAGRVHFAFTDSGFHSCVSV